MTDHTVTVWFARTGPCWCTGRPISHGSIDLERLRRMSVPRTALLDRDVVISPELVTPGLLTPLRALLERSDVISIVYPLCAQALPAMPSELFDVLDDVASPTIRLAECVSGYPETLVAALLHHLTAELERVADHSSMARAGGG